MTLTQPSAHNNPYINPAIRYQPALVGVRRMIAWGGFSGKVIAMGWPGCFSGNVMVIGWDVCWDTVGRDCCDNEVREAAVLGWAGNVASCEVTEAVCWGVKGASCAAVCCCGCCGCCCCWKGLLPCVANVVVGCTVPRMVTLFVDRVLNGAATWWRTVEMWSSVTITGHTGKSKTSPTSNYCFKI